MIINNDLPKIKNKKLINMEEFVKLAKKVKQSFDEQEEYLEKRHRGEYGFNTQRRPSSIH